MISKGLHYSLRLHLSTAFVLTLLIFGSVLGWFQYQKLTDLLVTSSEQLSDRIVDEVINRFNVRHQATANIVELLALSPLMETTNLNERFSHLPSLALALDSQPDVVALEIGFDDGDYFIIRKLINDRLRQRFEAPADAAYVVDSIEGFGGESFLERFYFDDQVLQLDYVAPVATDYDPRVRPWFKLALENPTVKTTTPYFFFFIGEVGVTVVKSSEFDQHVFGADITLEALSEALKANPVSESSEMFIVTADNKVIASRRSLREDLGSSPTDGGLLGLNDVDLPVVRDYLTWKGRSPSMDLVDPEQNQLFTSANDNWFAVTRPLSLPGITAHLLILTPERELLADAFTIRNQSVMITTVIILLSIPFSLLIAHFIAAPLRLLAAETQRIIRFDYSSDIQLDSAIKEIHELAITMNDMKKTIARFTELIRSVSAEKDFNPLLSRVTFETMQVSRADGALLYLMNDKGTAMAPMSMQNEEGEQSITALPSLSLDMVQHPLVKGAGAENVSVLSLRPEDYQDDPTVAAILHMLAAEEMQMVLVPLRNRLNQKVGLLCLLFDSAQEEGRIITEDARIAFVNALSGFSAITIESRYLLKAQKELLESFMQLIAGAIDEKSPYTGGHCQRVPVLTKMLARAACNSQEGSFAKFQLSDEEWEELHLAAWMHDCGKVTTPEYVVDKATKLETIYDRIHEIRMRFEVIKQSQAVETWKRIATGAGKDAELEKLQQQWLQVNADWEFVAACNVGSEGLSDDDYQRLMNIADRTWIRTLDDRLGISWEEAARRNQVAAPELPVEEKLLDDQPHHIFPWGSGERLAEDNPYGFKMLAPEVKYNRGERYNMMIRRGTLTEEERFIINNHIVQTIVMLEKLPFPRHLQDVPAIAGGHHEKMDGTGYPKQLTREQMPLTARMMAIADIFEALTASDRPYKEPKKLSDALAIMKKMAQGRHIDAELFELFLRSGVYVDYARRFLHPGQIDVVDVECLLAG